MNRKTVNTNRNITYRAFLVMLGLCILLFGWVTAVRIFDLELPAWPAWYAGLALGVFLSIFSLVVMTRELFRKMSLFD